ncbi:MAG: Membrane-associated protein [Syntrophomonadaceae bacterium]|nr:Membrane-associated protein [Bacillota bacterium]
MKHYKAKKVVIITEAYILEDVIKTFKKVGVKGYTVMGATGEGERGLRLGNGVSSLFKNVKIEVITSAEIAEKLIEEVVDNFFVNYAGIIYLEDVEVVQAKKVQLPE